MKEFVKYAKYVPYGVGVITGVTTLLLLRKPAQGKTVFLLIGGTLAGAAIGYATSSIVIRETVKHPEVNQQNL